LLHERGGYASGEQVLTAFGSSNNTTVSAAGGGTLSVIDGTKQATLSMAGHYTSSSFALANDGMGGTLVKFV
jgi:hypothetical protein